MVLHVTAQHALAAAGACICGAVVTRCVHHRTVIISPAIRSHMQAANDATSCMLIRAAGATGKPTYEALAEWAGGKAWKVGAAASSVLLSGHAAGVSMLVSRTTSAVFVPRQPLTCRPLVAMPYFSKSRAGHSKQEIA
jgi:hypothetical protein